MKTEKYKSRIENISPETKLFVKRNMDIIDRIHYLLDLKLDVYLMRDEFLFSLKGLNGADKVTFYKSFKNGLIKTQKFIDKFTK